MKLFFSLSRYFSLAMLGLVDRSQPTQPKAGKTTDQQREAQAIQKMREHLEELRKSTKQMLMNWNATQ